MNVRRIAAVAALGVAAAGVYAPAAAAPKKKPITKSYDLNLLPVPDPPSGTSCMNEALEGVSIHTETIKPTGPGVLSVKVNGSGDWDITILNEAREEVAVGAGTSTPTTPITTAGEDTVVVKFKKPQTILIAVCNFAGSLDAKAQYTYKYS